MNQRALFLLLLLIPLGLFTGEAFQWHPWAGEVCLVAGMVVSGAVVVSYWPLLRMLK
jgi:hypothetical protein